MRIAGPMRDRRTDPALPNRCYPPTLTATRITEAARWMRSKDPASVSRRRCRDADLGTRLACLERDGFADDEGDRFGFELSRVTRSGPVVGTMQQAMGVLVSENEEHFCG